MPVAEALDLTPDGLNTLLEPGYHKVENGFCELPDGTAYTASLVPFPGCTGEMFQWWFWWHSVEPARYTLWYPYSHVSANPVDREVLTAPGLTHEQRYIGNTHRVTERIGSRLVKISIRFVDPAELGFDTSRFAAADIVGHACAEVSLLRPDVPLTTMVHLARRTEQRHRAAQSLLDRPPDAAEPARSIAVASPGWTAVEPRSQASARRPARRLRPAAPRPDRVDALVFVSCRYLPGVRAAGCRRGHRPRIGTISGAPPRLIMKEL